MVHYPCVFGLFGLFYWGCLWRVSFLFLRFVVRALLPVRFLVVGCGRVGRFRPVRVGILRRPVCLCRLHRSRWRVRLRGVCRCWAGGCGCVLVRLARLFLLLAVCRCRFGRSSLRFRLGGRCHRFGRRCLRCRCFHLWLRWVFNLKVINSSPGVVAVAGSRALPASGSALVARVVSDLAAGGASLVVGCCTGADAALLSLVPGAVPPSLVRCLCAFGAGGAGSGLFSAVASVSAFAGSGGSVSWWAGGVAAVPLHVRLSARTRAVVAAASVGLVVFFGSRRSRGSLLACRCAVARGLPVLAFPVGFAGSGLPLLGAGAWVPVGGLGGFVWVSGQAVLF